ncbi:hypothetical protein LJ655_21920 [Paraburkholderia sp. MMS20-SJTN17]|uniref:Uncharacterized protein n=1 Tax=Paraburkholderia translucens TaxID=2886945 RepID=A0ABS8KIB6_9BURK|nr:hypothetical protein [Paraburkholderia sp. MMS20-SJTN17]MCC8404506.1 hypothetical protein [Paraburkholderia sp. MMS20-SJTN17]
MDTRRGGERLRIAFRLRSAEYDPQIETTAVVRNVPKGETPGEPTMHGLELDRLDAAQQMAMKCSCSIDWKKCSTGPMI